MPPKKELCRNFQRGSCQFGDRCKFLHATQLQPKPNAFGSGVEFGTQFLRTHSLQQKPNPFGFGVQNISQPRGAGDSGFKQDQFKHFENKWTRSSAVNSGTSVASKQSNNQPVAPNHKCTDPESCRRQIIEDFEHERPLWKLTCYGHCKSGPCDIVGDISYEELRATGYDDATRGLSIGSIVERERSTLNSKVVEFENLLCNPYKVPSNSTYATKSPFPGNDPNVSPSNSQNIVPPSVSSFSQLGASLSMGFGLRPPAPTNNLFGLQNSFHMSGQTSNSSGSNFSFGTAGPVSSQPPGQMFGSSFALGSSNLSNHATTARQNPLGVSPQIHRPERSHFPMDFHRLNTVSSAVAQSSIDARVRNNMPHLKGTSGSSIWSKEDWIPGEIPEEAPPDEVIF